MRYAWLEVFLSFSFLVHTGIFCAWITQEAGRLGERLGRVVTWCTAVLFAIFVLLWLWVLLWRILFSGLESTTMASATLNGEVWWFVGRAGGVLILVSLVIYRTTKRILFPLFVAWFALDLVLFALAGGFFR